MLETIAATAAAGPLADIARQIAAQVGDSTPYWGLIGLKGLDWVTGLMRAIAARDVQPAKLLRAPGGIAVITVAVAVCLSMQAVSPLFGPVVSAILVAFGGAEAASILQNLHDWYVVRGQKPPGWLATAAATLKTLEPAAPPAGGDGGA